VLHTGFYDTSIYNISVATQCVIKQLYKDYPPAEALYYKNIPARKRNQEIVQRYANGESLSNLSTIYGISEQRIHQIIRGRRK
jgi:hypothetical protein